MCDQFYERLGQQILDKCGSKLEVRKIRDMNKLVWILFNVTPTEDHLLLKKIAPYDGGQLYSSLVEMINGNGMNNGNGRKTTKYLYTIFKYHEGTLGCFFVDFNYENRTNAIYAVNGLISVSLPEYLKCFFDSFYEKYGEHSCKNDNRYNLKNQCILNDTLKEALTTEQMEQCELNDVFGPVIKIEKEWIVENNEL